MVMTLKKYTNRFDEEFKDRFILLSDINRWYQIQDLLKDDFVDIYKLAPAQTVTEWLNELNEENEILKAFLEANGFNVEEILTFGKQLVKE